jgi:hypothetical protein
MKISTRNTPTPNGKQKRGFGYGRGCEVCLQDVFVGTDSFIPIFSVEKKGRAMEICDMCRPGNAEKLPFGLPPSTKHILCENIRPLPGSVVEGSFYTVLRAEGNLAEDAVKWLKEYSNESRTVWRVQCAHRESGRKNVFKVH